MVKTRITNCRFKRFTSQPIVKHIGKSKRKQKRFLVGFFRKEAEKNSNVKHYQFWRHDNKPIEL
jgi:hypothetical protein